MHKPNIVLINCDDLGYGDLGCYGSRLNRTPYLDRMAAEGVRFTSFYQAASVCSASRAGLLTGCYPRRIGMPGVLFPGQGTGLNAEERTLAGLLKDRGYATRIIGKWHCGDQPEFLPTRFGFDGYYGIPFSNDMGRQADRHPGWDGNGPPPLPLLLNEDVIQQQPDQSALTERYVEDAVRFIRARREQPFFLYLAHMYVHLPIYVPDRFLRESRNGRYGAAVACVDWAYGVIAHELQRLQIDERTLVIFTSDNGSRTRNEGGSNDPLRGTKASAWEGGFRLPCIMRWPGRIPAGRVCPQMLASLDLLPTLVSLAGGAPPAAEIDGRDARALMADPAGARSPRDTFLYYVRETLCAVRRGRWKLFLFRPKAYSRTEDGEVCELYDLERDVGETEDVHARHPDVVAELSALADRSRAELGDERLGVAGTGCRPPGRVDNPRPLTQYDPEHPYIVAEYDLAERG